MMKNKLVTTSASRPFKTIPFLYWLIFFANLMFIVINYPDIPNYESDLFRFNGFSALIWLSVSFFSAVISSYSFNYLKGFEYYRSYFRNSACFTFSVLVLVISNSIWLFIAAWFGMGFFMANLIGINKKWGEARQAFKYTSRKFLLSNLLLGFGLLLLAYINDSYTLSGIFRSLDQNPFWLLLIAALFIISAALIQSAIFPFHKWLLSAMTAPTPASALMHAGFVNGSGILLTICAVLIFYSNTYDLLFIIGGITAIIAQFTKLLQVKVKHKLACSTIAQMGFMIMQCGLGFFNAAIAHLILHGFYKAYLFLSAGEEVKHSYPSNPLKIRIKPIQALLVIVFSLLGAGMFAFLTGKGFNTDSGIFLTLIVAITVGQATYNIVKEKSWTYLQRIGFSGLLFIIGVGLYSLIFNWTTVMMSDMRMIQVPRELSPVEISFGLLFFLGFFLMKLGTYRKIPWLYVKLLNASQPSSKTIHKYKTKEI
ncbi:proton-conducting transporter transmembrane domain-containing protein [Salegentibacter sp. HM20]